MSVPSLDKHPILYGSRVIPAIWLEVGKNEDSVREDRKNAALLLG
jgi:hypothetical protein